MIGRVQQALTSAGAPPHGINNACLCTVKLKGGQAPELSGKTKHPSSTDGVDVCRGKNIRKMLKRV